MAMDTEEQEKMESAREMFQILLEISNLLDTKLDKTSLTYCIRLCENGIHPESLAHVVSEMQAKVSASRQKESAVKPTS